MFILDITSEVNIAFFKCCKFRQLQQNRILLKSTLVEGESAVLDFLHYW